jgi:hypothetical protein
MGRLPFRSPHGGHKRSREPAGHSSEHRSWLEKLIRSHHPAARSVIYAINDNEDGARARRGIAVRVDARSMHARLARFAAPQLPGRMDSVQLRHDRCTGTRSPDWEITKSESPFE